MPYAPKLPCLRAEDTPTFRTPAVSPPPEIPVGPVGTGGGSIDLPLSRFAVEGRPLEARAPWWDETIWFVPGVEEAEELAQKGITRGRNWTAAELQQIAALDGLADTELRVIATIKAVFDCTVLDAVAMRPDSPPACRACHETLVWTHADGRQICARCHPPADRPSPADHPDDPGDGRPR